MAGDADIRVLVGVAMGGVDGDSVSEIRKGLESVMKTINEDPLKVKVTVDPASINDFKTKLSSIIDTLKLDKGVNITLNSAQLGQIAGQAKQAASSFESVKTAAKGVGDVVSSSEGKVAELNAKLKELSTTSSRLRSSYSATKEKLINSGDIEDAERLKNKYIELEAASEELRASAKESPTLVSEDNISNVERLQTELRELINSFSEVGTVSAETAKLTIGTKEYNEVLISCNNLLKQVTDGQRNWTAAKNGRSSVAYEQLEKYRLELTKLIDDLDGLSKKDALERLSTLQAKFKDTSSAIRETGENTKTLTERMGGLAQKFGAWLSVSQMIMLALRAVRKMITTSIELDDAMTQLKIVTQDTDKAYRDYADNIAESAKKIGSSITDLIDSTTTYARLGYSLDESSTLAEYTAMLQNVGDIDVESAQAAITAITKAYNIGADEIESVMDRMVTVGNNYPISVAELAEGMNNAGSALHAAGNDLNQSLALLTAANTTIQNISKASTGLRTITARIRKTDTELNDLGESMTEADYEAMVNALSKANVELTTATGEFRSTYDILKDIAAVWGDLTSMEQAALAETLSGNRQQNIFFSIVEQFQEAEGAMESMTNSAGALSTAYDTYMESTTAHINQFKAAFQELSQDTFTKDFLNDIVDLGTGFLGVLQDVMKLVNAIGGLKTVLAVVGTMVVLSNLKAIESRIRGVADAVKLVTSLITRVGGWSIGLDKDEHRIINFTSDINAEVNQLDGGVKAVTKSISGMRFAIGAATLIIGTAIAVYSAYQKWQEELRRSAEESLETYKSETKSLEEYSSKIEELKNSLENENLSQQESYDKRKELLSIQGELIDTYGDEARAIDILGDSVDGTNEKLDDLGQKLAGQTLTKSANEISKAVREMESENAWGGYIRPGGLSFANVDKSQADVAAATMQKIVDLASKYSTISAKMGDNGEWLNLNITGNVKQSREDVDAFAAEIRALDANLIKSGTSLKDLFGANGITQSLAEVSTKIDEIADKWEKIYDDAVLAKIADNQDYSDVMREYTRATKEYQDAIVAEYETEEERIRAISAALSKVNTARAHALELQFGDEDYGVHDYFDKLFSEFFDGAGKYQLQVDLTLNSQQIQNELKNKLGAFEGEDGTISLQGIYDSGLKVQDVNARLSAGARYDWTDDERAYVYLQSLADRYRISIDDLLKSLVALGYVQDDVTHIEEESASAIRGAISSYDTIRSSIEAVIATRTTGNNVISENTNLTEDEYKNIVALAGGEEALAGCVDTTNGYLVTNAKQLQKVIAASTKATSQDLKQAKAQKTLQYHKLVSDLKKLTSGMSVYDKATGNAINSILKQINSTRVQIEQYRLLEQQLLGVADAYTEIENAKEIDEAADFTDEFAGAFDDLVKAYENHEFGTETFRTAFAALIPENIYSQYEDAGEQIDAGWEYLTNKLARYITYDDGNISVDFDSVKNFVKDGLETSFGDSTVFTGTLDNFDINPEIKSIEDLAKAMNITTAAAFALATGISKYNADNADFLEKLTPDSIESKVLAADQKRLSSLEKLIQLAKEGEIGGDEWDEANREMAETDANLNQLREDARQNITANIELDSNISEKQKEVDDLFQQWQEAKDSGDLDAAAKLELEYKDAWAELAEFMLEKDKLEEPTELTISLATEQVRGEIDKTKAELDEIADYDGEQYSLKAEFSTDQEKIEQFDKLTGKLEELQEEQTRIETFIELNDKDVMDSLSTIEKFKIHDKDFSVDMDYGTVKDDLDYIVKKLAEIKDVDITATVTTVRNTVSKQSGDVEFSGTAHSNGDWGTESAERNALVGELGTELVVDPKTGRYYTVGDNGAEFVDLPKGAIVFNHLQTLGLLKNGRINSRGKAFLEGNAYNSLYDKDFDFAKAINYKGSADVSVDLDTSDLEDQLKDTLEKMADELEKILGNFEHKIFLMEHKRADWKEFVEMYRAMQDAVHKQAEKYRALGLEETSEYIQDLQQKWWEYNDSIHEVISGHYESLIGEIENAVKLSEIAMDKAVGRSRALDIQTNSANIVAHYKQIQDLLHEEAEYYRSLGYSDTSDEVASLSIKWNECADAIKESKQKITDSLIEIVTKASDAVDTVQSVYDTFKAAADEFSSNGGFISVDTFQKIVELGPQYLQYLTDQNGLLVINEQKIRDVIAAKTEDLALDSALAYVERIRAAANGDSLEDLDEITSATISRTNATWGLIYAQLEQLKLEGKLNPKQYQDAYENVRNLQSAAMSAAQSFGKDADNMRGNLDDIIKYTMAMLEKRLKDQIDALEELKKKFGEIISLRKEALDAAKEEADYEDEVAKKVKDIAKLQVQINSLSLDNSREAAAKRVKLEEDMAELQKELANKQNDHAIEAQKKALDEMQDAYEEQKDAEIDELENTMSSYQKKYDATIKYIESHWDTLYSELSAWNNEYGTVLTQEITNAWEQCLEAAKRYGSFTNALMAHGYNVPGATNTSAASIVKQMKANSAAWHGSDAEGRARLSEENVSLSKQLESLGVSVHSDNGTWYLDDGRKLFDVYGDNVVAATVEPAQTTDDDRARSLVRSMYINTKDWRSATPDERARRDKENYERGEQLRALGIPAIRGNDGVWYLEKVGGKRLYDVYAEWLKDLESHHTGGVAGNHPTLKQNEVLAVLEKGEPVLDKQKEKGLYRLIDFTSMLSKKLGAVVNSANLGSLFTGMRQDYVDMQNKSLSALTGSASPAIHFGDMYFYGTDEEMMQEHRRVNREFTNEILDILGVRK